LLLQRHLQDRRGIATTLGNLGVLALYRGNYAQAQGFFEEALELQRQLENKIAIAGALLNLGCVTLYQHEYKHGITSLRESILHFQELGDTVSIVQALEGLAGIWGMQSESIRAAQLFGAAESLRESIGAPLSPSDQVFYKPILEMTRTLLNSTSFEEAWSKGRHLKLEQAIDLAMAEVENLIVS
jgi:tetratricopeptide (TPR) repeat protein